MNKKLLPWLITICALGLGGTAAYYSIIGLSKLFAGVATAVIIMASFLEMSKLTLATLLHSYWDKLNIASKIYYVVSLIILSLLTSAGIYGMLSGGYQETANKSSIVDNQIKLLETKKQSFSKIKSQYETEKQSITKNISSLRNALGNNTQSYVDTAGRVITYSSSANRKAFERQLETAIGKDEKLTEKIQTLNDTIIQIETQIVETSSNSEVASELGPLKYLSNLTGTPMDKIINYLLLVIIFVFDPLAIALVIAANFAFTQLRNKETPPEEDWIEDWPDDNDEELEEASLTDLQNWNEEEPYEIYTPDSQDEWVIEDEEKEHEKQELEKQLQTLQNQTNEIQSNPHLSGWKKNKELSQLQQQQQFLLDRKKRLEDEGDIITYN